MPILTEAIYRFNIIPIKIAVAAKFVVLNQDGRVEGRALTPSCANTRSTTSCWTITDRKTLELTKKDTRHPKTKEKPQ